MNPGTTLRKGLKQLGTLWEAARYDQALALVERLLLVSPGNPALLVYRAQLTQLKPEGNAEDLDHARADLELASRLDEHSPVPLTELGYFTYAALDDPATAEKHLRKAITRCRALLREALLGRAKALSELGRDDEAFACLAEARALPAGTAGPSDRALLDEFRTLVQSSN